MTNSKRLHRLAKQLRLDHHQRQQETTHIERAIDQIHAGDNGIA